MISFFHITVLTRTMRGRRREDVDPDELAEILQRQLAAYEKDKQLCRLKVCFSLQLVTHHAPELFMHRHLHLNWRDLLMLLRTHCMISCSAFGFAWRRHMNLSPGSE